MMLLAACLMLNDIGIGEFDYEYPRGFMDFYPSASPTPAKVKYGSVSLHRDSVKWN